MQYEKISVSNKYSVTLTLSRPMAEFLFDVLSSEVVDQPVNQKYDRKKLKRIADVLWQYIKPTPAQEKSRMQRWVKKLNLGRFDTEALPEQKKRLQGHS
ncbi:MAG: hypothetical protein WBL28_08445 [Methylotenera sp.]